MSNKTLGVVGLVVASKTADENIKLQAFVTGIRRSLKNKKTKSAKKSFHILDLSK